MQLVLSRVHARLVPMRRVAGRYEIHPGAQAWFSLPLGRGFAGYGLGRALRMLLDVLRGLAALHDTFTAAGEPFAHGEVALTHFRVDAEGVCRLVPLTARHSSDEAGAPHAGTLLHLAPERLLGEVLDSRADVFSAGILLWEALAGRRLFEETTSEAIIDRLMTKNLRMPQLPPELAWAIPLKSVAARALAVHPHQRFSDCSELATAIAIVARERVATHGEVASFFGAAPRSMERVRSSVPPSGEEPRSMSPAMLMPASGPRLQRRESITPSSEARERPVPSQSQTFSAVAAPSSRDAKRSARSPLGSASSQPPALPVTEAAQAAVASDPSFTPIPRAFRTSSLPLASAFVQQQSPFSTRLMPPLDPLPALSARAPALPALGSRQPLRSSEVPRSTFPAVVSALPVIVDEDVIDAATMFRGAPARKLWTVLAVTSVSAALAVAALTHSSSPSPSAAVALASAQPARAPLVNAASDHAPATLPAPVSTVHASTSAPAKGTDVHESHSATRASKRGAAGKLQAGEKDYGI